MGQRAGAGDARPYILAAIALVVGIGLFLTVVIRYSLSVAPGLNREAKPVIDQFYACSQRRDFEGARALFSPDLQDNISTADLGETLAEIRGTAWPAGFLATGGRTAGRGEPVPTLGGLRLPGAGQERRRDADFHPGGAVRQGVAD